MENSFRISFLKLFLILLILDFQTVAQTTLISDTGDGGFENGSGFNDNGWTVVNHTTNTWQLGGASGAAEGTQCAFISNNSGTSWAYTNSLSQTSHFYRDITVPVNEPKITLGFQWKGNGEAGFDRLLVYVAPTNITPSAGTPLSSSTILNGATLVFTQPVFNQSSYTGAIVNLPASLAGTTFRLIFTWQNNNFGGSGPGAAIDKISLVSAACIGFTGTKTIGPGGDFLTLTSAISSINSADISGPVLLELNSGYVSTGETFPIVLSNNLCANSTNTLTIRPASDAVNLSISSSNSTATLDINNSSFWIIDGRPGGNGTRNMSIANNSLTGAVIRYVNDATNNTVRHTIIRGVNSSTTGGLILFSNTTGGTGNDNNTIDNCDLREGASTPVNCIYSAGTTTTTSQNNSGNTISNCNIYNFFIANGTSAGISLQGGNTDWVITGNSFYQTTNRTTTAAATAYGITIANSSGNNFIVAGNYIGGSGPNASGSPWTVTGNFANRFNGIGLSVGTVTTSVIQGNTIANFAFSSSSSATFNSTSAPLGTGIWGGIMVGAGNVDIGTASGNTIGAPSGNGSISVTGSTSGGTVNGIGISGSGTITISNNVIGSITTAGSTTSVSTGILAIHSESTGVVTINNNTIGSSTTSNSLNASTSATGSTAQVVTGIDNTGLAISINISNNIITNLNNAYSPTSSSSARVLAGIFSGQGAATINGNTISNLSTTARATGTGASTSVIGISVINTSSSTAIVVSKNIIKNLSNTNTGAFTTGVTGINFISYSNQSNRAEGNFIHGINTSSTANTGFGYGINVTSGTSVVQNNMVCLNGNNTGINVRGINDTEGANSYYHNSVYVGGSPVSGAANTFAFFSSVTTGTRNFKNNIFFNGRSNNGSTGKHYAISIAGTTANPAGLACNYNNLFVTGTGGVLGLFNAIDRTNINAWRVATGQDINSISSDPLFVSITTPDLHLNGSMANASESAGTTVPVGDDFDGEVRSGLTPIDLGADAGNFPLDDKSAPEVAFISTPSSTTCTSINPSLTANITDVSSGVNTTSGNAPRLYFKKKGDANSFSGNTANDDGWKFVETSSTSSPYSFTLNGSLLRTPVTGGDTIQYFIVAQDNAALPNVGIAGGFFSGTPSGVDLNISAFPITGNLNFIDFRVPVSNTITIGASGTYPSLTGTNGLFAAINSGGLSGNTVATIIDAAINETGTVALNQVTSGCSGTATLTIKPQSSATLSGSVASGALIKLNGADNITIDGSNNGGTDRSLTITNSASSSPCVIWIASLGSGVGAVNNTIKNCNLNASAATTATAYGISISGSTIGSAGADNDNITVQNNAINSRNIGIYANGTSSASSGGIDNLLVSGNSFSCSSTSGSVFGVEIGNALNASVSQNIFNLSTSAATTPVGISLETGVSSGSVTANRIQSVFTSNTGGYGGRGITIGTGSATSNITIANNFIAGVNGSNSTSFGSSSSGIMIGVIGNSSTLTNITGGVNVYHNTVNMLGNYSFNSSCVTAGLYNGSGTTALDIRNNILVNSLNNTGSSGTASKNYAIYSAAASSAFATIDYNNYHVSGLQGMLGYLSSNRSSLSDITAAFGGNSGSLSFSPVFAGSSDLHLDPPGANIPLNNSGSPLASVTVDIDGEPRNPAPDIGADEFTPTSGLDISVTALLNPLPKSCHSNSEDVQVRLSNYSVNSIDFSINPVTLSVTVSGATSTLLSIIIDSGVLAGGASQAFSAGVLNTMTNGTYQFSISTSLTGDVNTSNDILNTGIVINNIPATVTIGAAESFSSLTGSNGLFAAINSLGLSVNTTAVIVDNSVSETGTVALDQQTFGCSGRTLTIKPQTTTTLSGSVSSGALIKLNGADNVTIDGSNNGGTDRSLTITNSASSSPCVIWIASLGSGVGAVNNTIKNCNLNASAATTATAYGISISGSTIGSAGADNDNIKVQNNAINSRNIGIYANGFSSASSGGIDNLLVSGNSFSCTSNSGSVFGVKIGNTINASVTQNIFNLSTSAATTPVGISLESGVSSSSVMANRLQSIITTNTGGYGGRGITIGTGSATSNVTVANNFIAGVNGSNFSSFANSSSAGIHIGVIGNSSALGTIAGGINVYHNSINLFGTYNNTSTCITSALYIGSSASDIDIRNNILVNSLNNTNAAGAGSRNYAIYSAAASSAFTSIDFNNYYVTGTQGITGYLSADRSSLADITTAFGGNLASLSIAPVFAGSTDLHLDPPSSNSLLNNAGTPLPSITTDIDGESRNPAPDIGADEFSLSSGLDMSVTALMSPLTKTCHSTTEDVLVRLTNYSIDSIDFSINPLTLSVSVSGVTSTLLSTTINSGVLAGGASQTFSAGVLNTMINGTYQFTISSSLTGDLNTSNDLLTTSAVINNLPTLVTIGSLGTYGSLTGSNGLFAAINSFGLNVNTTVIIIDSAVSETGAVALEQIGGCQGSTLSIKPQTTSTLSGSVASGAVIKLNGADNVTIDGSNNGGTDRSLTIANSASSTPCVIWFASQGTGAGSVNNTIKNCNLNAYNATNSNAYAVSVSGSTIGSAGADNDNIVIQNNAINSRNIGIYANGTSSASSGGIDNLLVTGNIFSCISTSGDVFGVGIRNALNAIVTQNTINLSTSAATTPVGISLESGVSSSAVVANRLQSIITTNTNGYGSRGITIGTGLASSNITISNNFISGVNGSNYSSFGNSSSAGIMIGVIGNSTNLSTVSGGINVYHNSINLFGNYNYNAACITAALYIGSGASAIDVRNNILVNSLNNTNASGSGSSNYAIYSAAASSAFTSIDYNNYYVSGLQGVLGYLSSNRSSLSDITAAFGGNSGSLNFAPVFAASTDLHLDPPNANIPLNNSGTPLPSVSVDIDSEPRNSSPDIGADEFYYSGGVDLELFAVANPSSRSCHSTTENVQINIKNNQSPIDFSINPVTVNVTITGAAYANLSTTINSGILNTSSIFTVSIGTINTLNDGTYNFSCSLAVPGDNNVANDQLNTTAVIQNIPATVTIGSSGNYPNLSGPTGLFKAINTYGLQNNLTAIITDTLVSETGQVALNPFDNSCGGTPVLTIKPQDKSTLKGINNSGAIIILNGADNVIIDGSNSGGTDRSLTIATSAETNGRCAILISSQGIDGGAEDITIKNTIISTYTGYGGSNSYGISISGSSVGTPGADNDNITITNNYIHSRNIGLYANGSADVPSGGLDNLVVSGNSFYSNSVSGPVTGLELGNALNASITHNTFNLSSDDASSPVGISIETGVSSSSINSNRIQSVENKSSSSNGSRGITLGTGNANSNITIVNNFIAGVTGKNSTGMGFSSAGIAIGVLGGNSNTSIVTGGINIYHNTVNMSGNYSNNLACVTAGLFIGNNVTGLDIRNNILVNTMVNTNLSSGVLSKNYAIHCSAGSNTPFSMINYNDYFVSGSQGILGYLSSDRLTLADLIIGFGGNSNSVNTAPFFATSSDLHLSPINSNCGTLGGLGIFIPSVSIDIDGDTRGINPEMGADELDLISGVDPRIISLKSPSSNSCHGSTENVEVILYNNSIFPHDFSINPVSLSVSVSGPVSASYSTIINNGVLSCGTNQTVTMGTLNTLVSGNFVFTTNISTPGDQDILNNSLTSTVDILTLPPALTIGAAGNYPNLTDSNGLFNAINKYGLAEDLVATIIDDSITESGMISLNTVTYGCGGTKKILIRPGTGIPATLTGNSLSVINLYGADNVTIDGINSNGSSLTIINSYDSSSIEKISSVINISNADTADACLNDTIRNCTIKGLSQSNRVIVGISTGKGFYLQNLISSNSSISPHCNIGLINNRFLRLVNAVIQSGGSNPDSGWTISGNIIGSTDEADDMNYRGLFCVNASNFNVYGNSIYGVKTKIPGYEIEAGYNAGIQLEGDIYGFNIYNNIISGINQPFDQGGGAYGIYINSTGTLKAFNNMLYDIRSYGNTVAKYNGHGIFIASASDPDIHHNTIHMNTSQSSPAGISSAIYAKNGLNIRLTNNIIAQSGSTGQRYALFSEIPSGSFSQINHNCYSSTGSLGFINGTARNTLANMIAGFGQNASSINLLPTFFSSSDLHIKIDSVNSPLNGSGNTVAGIGFDIDNQNRSNPPDIGADEFDLHLTINVQAILEGYHIGNGLMTPVVDPQQPSTCDSITVELHEATSPYGLVHTHHGAINTSGNIIFNLPVSLNNISCYIVIRHRNTIETWSKNPVLLSGNTFYDFTY